jgi:hypothetical protein
MKRRSKEMSTVSSSHATEIDPGPAAAGVASRPSARSPKSGPAPLDSRGALSEPMMSLPHERVAERAKALWMASGCVPGRDEQNWREAEAQLRAESKSR